ncbi:uncharacterized protein LOC136091572 isoform X2 [Hydra vulgaris]|uniref:Uncharacterized protein LOC136076861 isoform X2 n=1 Tax=Hydra vulgaris TaxID=6087 RepID=A0ABM4DGG2_HYDVU
MRYITINNIKYEVFSDTINDQFFIIQNEKKKPISLVFPYDAKREKEMQKLRDFKNFVRQNFVDETRFSRTRRKFFLTLLFFLIKKIHFLKKYFLFLDNPYPRSPPSPSLLSPLSPLSPRSPPQTPPEPNREVGPSHWDYSPQSPDPENTESEIL